MATLGRSASAPQLVPAPGHTLAALALILLACGGGGGGDLSTTGGTRNPTCTAASSTGEVAAPEYLRHLSGQTSWYASPIVIDLDGDGDRELVAAYYDVYVFASDGELLATLDGGDGRIYAPHVVADIDGDSAIEIVYGNGHQLYAYQWNGDGASLEPGWPVDTTTADNPPEVRGLAAADLDQNGTLEIIATTTQTAPTADGGAQLFVFAADGTSFQPPGAPTPAWPRYDNLTGPGHDADRNGMGHAGFGCYGLNVGVGNLDDDDALEIVVTYDNHHIQLFDPDGVAIDAAPYFTNRTTDYAGERLTWGQFIRWADPAIEEDHYHLHTGDWPNPTTAEWLQWTASPPSVVDLDRDGVFEVVGVPNVEMHEPYETQAYAIMVLEGAGGDGSRSAMRKPGWEALPRGDRPIEVDGWYPPGGVPAPVAIDLQGDDALEIVVSLNDGSLYVYTATAARLWRFDYRHGKSIIYASEPTVADLNQDGSPEVLFTTYGAPEIASGYLVILGADGSLLHDVALPDPGVNGNGNGAPAAPTVADLDGDGDLEVIIQTFDHGMDIFTIPGSAENCVLWGTARGGPLRTGRAE